MELRALIKIDGFRASCSVYITLGVKRPSLGREVQGSDAVARRGDHGSSVRHPVPRDTCNSASQVERVKLRRFMKKLAKEELVIPSIAAIEFLKVVGSVIGRVAAETKLRLWIRGEASIYPIEEEAIFITGEMALKYRSVPLADVTIAAMAKLLDARVVSGDPHFELMGIRTVWYEH